MQRDKKNTLIDSEDLRVQKSPILDTLFDHAEDNASGDDTGQKMPVEINGPKGLEPTRYGDWEQKGRCTDF